MGLIFLDILAHLLDFLRDAVFLILDTPLIEGSEIS